MGLRPEAKRGLGEHEQLQRPPGNTPEPKTQQGWQKNFTWGRRVLGCLGS